MKKILILIMLFKVINLIALNTEYPEIKTYSDEWQKAGLNVDFPTNNEYTVVNLSNANGSNINDLIDSYSGLAINNQLLIEIPAGTFIVTEPILMKSYVTIKGNHMFKKDSDMENRTILNFDFDNDYSEDEPTSSIIKSDNDFYQIKLGSGSLDNDIETPISLAINNYPNPFNPETTISFNNPKSGNVSLAIHNIKGQLVKTLLDEDVSAGTHSIVWNGKNESGKAVSSGLYFTKIKTGTVTKIKKMILMK